MATGKSLELAQIKPKSDLLCTGCGLPWEAHLKKRANKEGYRERLKKYESNEHRVNGTAIRAHKKPTKAERRAHKRRAR